MVPVLFPWKILIIIYDFFTIGNTNGRIMNPTAEKGVKSC